MKRRHFVAELLDGGRTLATSDTYAMNSGIRASEKLAREYALSTGIVLEGDNPSRYGDTYTRMWRGPGVVLTARVAEVYS